MFKAKFVSRVFLPFFVVWLCVMPSRAYAIGPALALVAVAEGGGTTAVSGAAASAWGTLLGLSLAAMSIVDGAATRARLPTTSDPALAVPAPDALPSVGPVTGWQWSAGAGTCPGGPSGATHSGFVTYAAALADYASTANQTALCSPEAYAYSSNGTQLCYSYYGQPLFCYTPSGFSEASSCPAGYTLQTGVCTLANPREASPDNNCDYSRSGTSFSQFTDPDCGGVVCVGDTCTAVGVAADGDPMSFIITNRPDGGSTITVLEGGLIGNTTVTDSVVVGVSPAGIVESVTGATNSGSLPAAGTLPSGPVVNPAPVTVNFPADYARTGEAQTAANTINSKLDELKFPYQDVASKLGIPPASETIPTETPTFNYSAVLFSSAAGCPAAIPINFTVSGFTMAKEISYQPFCDFASVVRPIFIALATITAAIIFMAGLTL